MGEKKQIANKSIEKNQAMRSFMKIIHIIMLDAKLTFE